MRPVRTPYSLFCQEHKAKPAELTAVSVVLGMRGFSIPLRFFEAAVAARLSQEKEGEATVGEGPQFFEGPLAHFVQALDTLMTPDPVENLPQRT